MIHIVCNIDSNYVRHCAVTLVSLRQCSWMAMLEKGN